MQRAVSSRVRALVVTVTGAMLPLVTGGCTERTSASARWEGVMRDSAGITIMENRDTPVWRAGEAWQFTRALRIGVVEGEEPYMIGSITGLVILSDGRVVIGDGQNHNVRFFSPEGVHEITVGQGGSGPGEFAGPINLLLGPGDTILAVDRRNARANVISPEGTWVRSFPTLPTEGFYIYSWDDDETTRQIVSLLRPLRGGAAPDDLRYDYVVRRDLQGAYLDTLARLPTSGVVGGDAEEPLFHIYRGAPDYDLCDGQLVTGQSDEYRLTWQRADGTVQRIATLDRQRDAFTDVDQQVLLDRFDRLAEQSRMPQERAALNKSRFRFESTYPAFRRFVCGPEGTILVQRVRLLRELPEEERNDFALDERPLGADEWDVFDREGRYLGVAPLPTPPHRHAFTRDATGAWVMSGIERDELDVPYAGVWRIEGVRQ